MALQDRLDALKADFESGRFPLKPTKEALDTMHRATAELIDSAQVISTPTSDRMLSSTVQVRSVSRVVKLLRRQTTQKPASFIQEQPMAPNPMARKM